MSGSVRLWWSVLPSKIVLLLAIALCPSTTVLGDNLLLPGVLSAEATQDDWKELRGRIQKKILETWGKCPVEFGPARSVFREGARYDKYGLTFAEYHYQVAENSWDRGILVLPPDFQSGKKYPVVLAIHGTNSALGADGMLDPVALPRRAYGIELAKKGYVVFCPDHFGFGENLKGGSQEEVFVGFESQYPQWSIVGRQMLGLIRAVDFVWQLPFVDTANGVGVIGHSLGGRSALYLAAFDLRISAAVVSAGVSPMVSNTYRGLGKGRRMQPLFWDEVSKSGHYPWDYDELIALCAPRALLVIEPSNDPFNPSVGLSTQAVLGALPVWQLLHQTERLNLFIHGDGHDTTDEVRSMAYLWLDRFLLRR